MISVDSLSATILESIKRAQKEEINFEEIYNDSALPVGKNEFLFFIKPEITLPSSSINLEKIIEMVQKKIKDFGLQIHNVKTLSAKYLNRYNIIAQHYGVINKISSNAVQNLSGSAKEKFKELYGKDIAEVKLLGGLEFLEMYPAFNPLSLDYLWQNLENKKLAGGTYCEMLKIDNEIIYLVNGFHPRQLKHFTEKGRSIIVMTLSGDLAWSDARNNFIGATNPAQAAKGSLRRELLDNKDAFGMQEVSQGVNGFHLSAGPVEALLELKRYNSDFSKDNGTKDFSEFSFGKNLKEYFSNSFEKIVENSNVESGGKQVSIFDLTEEKNADESINILKKHFTS